MSIGNMIKKFKEGSAERLKMKANRQEAVLDYKKDVLAQKERILKDKVSYQQAKERARKLEQKSRDLKYKPVKDGLRKLRANVLKNIGKEKEKEEVITNVWGQTR